MKPLLLIAVAGFLAYVAGWAFRIFDRRGWEPVDRDALVPEFV